MARLEETCQRCGQPVLRITKNVSEQTIGIFDQSLDKHKCSSADIKRYIKSLTR